MSKLIKSESVYWCEGDDRYVRVFKEGDVVVGINYMQGDYLKYFESNFSNIDKGLTKFYNSIEGALNGTTEIDRINQAIWAHFAYENN
jgi:hypothetical protein